ncbi:kinase-like domain-containing protein [Podospora didyma]|uniref:non-specific serine/threonine protein kinase n=1 Tax=Podospora didyma TaxID=330526 RepID=A0AAE0K0N9_9PEZI|nr:kinase-like domain-containing protein [Podospora didyma]
MSPPAPETTTADRFLPVSPAGARNLEPPAGCQPGGYHPIHLGDFLGPNGQYEILCKPGHGSNWTAWLALDRSSGSIVHRHQQRRALIRALPPNDNRVVGLRSVFSLDGPNGWHVVMVLEAMGPDLVDVLNPICTLVTSWRISARWGAHTWRSSFDSREASAECRVPLIRRDGQPADYWAPRCLVEPAPLVEWLDSFGALDPMVKLTDLGGRFFVPQQGGGYRGRVAVNVALRAPEVILNSQPGQYHSSIPLGKEIDIWTFGCLTFELLMGGLLFKELSELAPDPEMNEETNNEHLIQLVEVLEKQYFDEQGRRRDLDGDSDDNSDDTLGSGSDSVLAEPDQFNMLEKQLDDGKPADMNEDEMQLVLTMLRRVFRLEPSRRPSAQHLLTHPWFAGV